MTHRVAAAFLFASSLGLTGWATTLGIAVKRGQKTIDPGKLPLVCIVVATDDIALPLDVIVFENLDTHENIRAILLKTFNKSHPDMLTALAGDHRSLSMPILHLAPGRYMVKSLEFVGPPALNAITSFNFNLAPDLRFSFHVRPSCVNYVGSLVILADWNGIPRLGADPNTVNPAISREVGFGSRISIQNSIKRDIKWASDVVPGMGGLPAAESMMEEEPPPKQKFMPVQIQEASLNSGENRPVSNNISLESNLPVDGTTAEKTKSDKTVHVVVEFSVDSDGSPKDIKIIESENKAFDKAVIESVSKWHFSTEYSGKRVRQPFEFSNEETSPGKSPPSQQPTAASVPRS